MANFHTPPGPGGGGGPAQGPHAYKKGLGFIPNSIGHTFRDPIIELVKILPKFSRICSPIQLNPLPQSTIPLINLDKLSEMRGDPRKQLIKQLGDGLRQHGFVGIHATSLTPMIDRTYDEMKHYFHQSFDQKVLDWQGNYGLQGFYHQGLELALDAKYADIKESYYIPQGFNRWPKNLPSFSKAVGEYRSYMHEYAKSLLKVVFEYLGREHAEAENAFSQRNSVLRLSHYPTLKPTDHAEALWGAPHKDPNALTMMPPGSIPGLEVLNGEGHWRPVLVPRGYLIISAGLQIEHKTAGLIKARVHRVINPGGKLTLSERYSTAYFGSFVDDYSLEPFRDCIKLVTHKMSPKRKRSFMKQYPTITVREKTI